MISHTYYLGKSALDWCDKFTYLGVGVNTNLNWRDQVAMVKFKATRRLNLLRRSMFYCSSLAKLRAYLSLVRPLMDYCTPVWSPYQQYLQHDLEIIQKRAARWICGARWDSSLYTWSRSYDSCMRQLHLLPVITRHDKLFQKKRKKKNPIGLFVINKTC